MDCTTWSLQFMAAVAYAKSLWEKPPIKMKMIKAFKSSSKSYSNSYPSDSEKKLAAVTQDLIIQVKKESLPGSVCDYIVHIIKLMEARLFNWVMHLQNQYRLNINYTDAIHWTNTGTIDQIKVFQEWLSNEKMVAQIPCEILWKMASRCAQIEFFRNHSAEIKKYVNKHEYSTSSEDSLIKCTFSYANKNNGSNTPDSNGEAKVKQFLLHNQFSFIGENKCEPAHIFCLAVEAGCAVAAKYFWSEMTAMDQEENILSNANNCVKMYKIYYTKKFIQDNYAELLVFLISKMPEDQRKEFLKNNGCKVLCMLLPVWPKEIFIPLWEKVKSSFSASECSQILKEILMLCEKDNNLGLNSYQDFYFEIFETVWCFLPENFKREIMNENKRHYRFSNNKIMYKLFKMFHVQGLKLVINDEDLKSERDYLIGKGKSTFESLVTSSNYEKLNLFVQEVFNSDEEKEKFKLGLNFYYNLIVMYGKLDEAKQLLNWHLDSKGSRQELIDCGKICEEIVKRNRYDIAENFIEWIFETEEEKERLKNYYRSDDFIRKKIFTMWSASGEDELSPSEKEKHSVAFLNWLFKTEDKVNEIKKEKLIMSDECVMMFCKMIKGSDVPRKIRKLEAFLVFCEVPAEKITNIKKNLLEKVRQLVLSNDASQIPFSIIEFLLKWSAGSEIERTNYIKTLMQSADIISFWDRIITTDRFESERFFNEWIRKSRHVTKLKNEVMLRKNTMDSETYSICLNCLQAAEKGNQVRRFGVLHCQPSDDSDEANYYYGSFDSDSDVDYSFMKD